MVFFGVWDVLILMGTLLAGLYAYGTWKNGVFSRGGMKSLPSSTPIMGDMMGVIMKREHFKDLVVRLYTAFPTEKFMGFMQFIRPLVVVRDLEALKQMTIKDFDHFQDHTGFEDKDVDPLFGRNVFAMKGEEWRDMRATLSPAFTSSKMRNMFDFVAECGDQMANFFTAELAKPENKGREYLTVEMKDAFTRYTNDVIATSAFGIKVDSLKDRDNEFYTMGKRATDFTGIKLLKFFANLMIPKLSKIVKMPVIDTDVSDFFRNIVNGTMKIREEQNIHRPDMIQLLMAAKKGSLQHETHKDDKDAGFATVDESTMGKQVTKREWTDDDIVAQAIIFFIAGFDTSSTLLCFMAHELMLHQDIQKRLQEEIDEVSAKNGGKLHYSDLQAMKYMDMVVSETLRLWPPVIVVDRKCIHSYPLPQPPGSKGKPFIIQKGDAIWIPIYGIHHDPQYYEDPEKFDPERFSDENKGSINPMAFIPFGVGPRNCIGSRFALMEAKAVMFHLLSKFDFVMTPETQHPIQLTKSTFNMHSEKGFWIGLRPRT